MSAQAPAVSAYHVGLAQILVKGGEAETNLARAVGAVASAASAGCRVVVLPECLDLGWAHPSAHTLAEPIPGPRTAVLAEAAHAHGVFVVAGLVERAGDRRYNAAVLLAPTGEILLHHRKINELEFALDLYDVGDRLGVVDCRLGRVGLSICADNFPGSTVLGHALCRMGAQIIFAPSAWAVPAGHDNAVTPYGDEWQRSFGELARLYNTTVIGVSNVGWITGGAWQGRKCIGCSLAIGPGGEVLARAAYGADAESLTVVEVTPRSPGARGSQLADLVAQRSGSVCRVSSSRRPLRGQP